MKSKSDLKKEIEELNAERIKGLKTSPPMKTVEMNRILNRVSLLKTCVMYLESNPQEEFIKCEIERVKDRIDKISDGFYHPNKDNMALKDFGKLKKDFEKLYNVPKLKVQLSTLKFILE